MTIRSFAAGAFVLGAAIAAFPASAGVIRHDVADSKYLTLGANPAFASVGQVFGNTSSYSFLASGVLISTGADSWVLTAGHVTAGATALSIQLGGEIYDADAWFSHSKWNGDLARGYDIGLMRFDNTDIYSDTGVEAATLYGSNGERGERGEIGTFVGYGTTGTGETGWDGSLPLVKRAGENVIDMFLNTGGKPGNSRVLLADFDNPLKDSDSSWGSPDPLALEYLIAPGDSGGGLFLCDEDKIQCLLAGIHSFGWGRLDGDPNSDYGDASGHTRVSMFIDWIMEAMGLSGGSTEESGGGGKDKPNKGKKPNGLMAYPYIEVPEPGTMTLLAVGFAGIGLARRRRAAG